MSADNLQRTIADLHTPIGAFARLGEFNPVFLLENVEHEGVPGRYSFIGLDPISTITYDSPDKLEPAGKAPFLEMLRGELAKLTPAEKSGIRLPAGLVGVTSFEITRELAGIPLGTPKEIGLHDAVFVIPRLIIAFDHFNHSIAFYQTNRPEPDPALVRRILDALRSASPPPSAGGNYSEASASISPEHFMDRVRRAKEYIGNGDIFQVVLSICFAGETDIEPFRIYRALRHLNPSPYLYYLNFNGLYVLGSSPETLVRVEGEDILLRPMGGTRPRSRDPAEDRRLNEELLSDEKENAEHMMRVDQARNDCARVCVPGTLKVPELRRVEHYSHVMHLVSSVTGRKRPEADIFDVFGAVFPAGTVSGSPKMGAVKIISELEEQPRGPYAGAVGYFAPDGTMDQAIAIRTMVIQGNKYRVQGGAGIVADSVPQLELEEVQSKTGALLQALQIARDEL